MLSLSIWIISLAPLTSAAVHSLHYFYTATSGIPGFPEFIGVGKVDGVEISYYDSNSNKAVPKQDWMKTGGLDDDYWLGETHVAMGNRLNFKKDIGILKSRFNQTGGVHTIQKMYGCQWDDETQAIDGFERFGYDGEDFMTLDLDNLRWIATAPQSRITTKKWNSEGELAFRKYYFYQICVEWLKKYVYNGQDALKSRAPPEVSFLQRGSGVACHATGFYPDSVMITWKRDGVEMRENVDVGETLPNEDGTFQKRAVLMVSPEERKKKQYSCEVTHKSGEPIDMIFQEEDPISANIIVVAVVAVAVLSLLVGGLAAYVMKMKNKDYEKASYQSDTSSDNSAEPAKA